MLILSLICSSLEFSSANLTSIYENSELNFFKKNKFVGEICNNQPNDIFVINVNKTLKSC